MKLRVLLFGLFSLVSLLWLHQAYIGLSSSMRDLSQHMEYVWLVPLLTVFLLGARRKQIVASIGQPAPVLALPFFLLACFLLFLGLRGGQTRFLQAGTVFFLMGMPLACFGKRTFAVTWFPLLLLLFVIPVGFLDNFTVPLRRASVSVTTALLNGLGIGVRQQGTAILSTGTPFFQLDVADPCSGIRSLVALFAGTAAYGAYCLNSVARRWVLFLMSVPIAFVGNILRLLLTALTCHLVSQTAGLQLHDNALFIVAPFYVVAVFGLTDLLRKKDCAPKEYTPLSLLPVPAWKVVGMVLMCAALVAFRWMAGRELPPATFETADFLNPTFAQLPGATLRYPWYCQNRACLRMVVQAEADFSTDQKDCAFCDDEEGFLRPVSRAEVDILPADTTSRKAIYTLADGSEWYVSLVIAGRNRMSIHRPELCLPSQGFRLSERHVRTLLPDLPMACFSLSHPEQSASSGFAYLFLNARGATVSNLYRVLGDCWERSVNNRIQRWAMVTIHATSYDFTTPEGEAALQRFMALWYPTLLRSNHD